jgi:hypothetical protein
VLGIVRRGQLGVECLELFGWVGLVKSGAVARGSVAWGLVCTGKAVMVRTVGCSSDSDAMPSAAMRGKAGEAGFV